MSALGQKQTFAVHQPMSALPPIATSIAFFGVSALNQSGHSRRSFNQLGEKLVSQKEFSTVPCKDRSRSALKKCWVVRLPEPITHTH
jgi:hypothetical protein